jgi:hypothetical protein
VNYLENKKKQTNMDTYLYEGLDYTIQLVKLKINLIKNKSKVADKFKNIYKYFIKNTKYYRIN